MFWGQEHKRNHYAMFASLSTLRTQNIREPGNKYETLECFQGWEWEVIHRSTCGALSLCLKRPVEVAVNTEPALRSGCFEAGLHYVSLDGHTTSECQVYMWCHIPSAFTCLFICVWACTCYDACVERGQRTTLPVGALLSLCGSQVIRQQAPLPLSHLVWLAFSS